MEMVIGIIVGVGIAVAGCFFLKKRRWKQGLIWIGIGLLAIGISVGVLGGNG